MPAVMSVTGAPTLALAGDGHQPRHALRDQVEAAAIGIRPGPPEAGDLAIDEAGIVAAQLLVAESQALHGALAVILDDNVSVDQQPAQRRLGGLLLEVEDDAALVAVHHHEGGGFAVDVGRQEAAAVVALRLFHLHDVGTHVGEHQPANGTGHDMGELDDPHALYGPRGSRLLVHVQRPCHRAGRFCRNASRPSRKSSLV
jgi:hypothetical protein